MPKKTRRLLAVVLGAVACLAALVLIRADDDPRGSGTDAPHAIAPPATGQVTAESDDQRGNRLEVATSQLGSATEGRGDLRVVVQDDHGASSSGATVTVSAPGRDRTATTDSAGVCEFPGLPFGIVDLSATDGTSAGGATFGFFPEADRTARVVLAGTAPERSQSFTVLVTRRGSPLGDALVAVCANGRRISGQASQSVLTDANGLACFRGIRPNWGLVAVTYGDDMYRHSFNTLEDQQDHLLVRVDIDAHGTLEGRVVDAQGRPLAGVGVVVSNAFGRFMTADWKNLRTRTDAYGNFALSRVAVGDYYIAMAEDVAYCVYSKPVIVDGQRSLQAFERLRLTIAPDTTATCVVRTVSGATIRGTIAGASTGGTVTAEWWDTCGSPLLDGQIVRYRGHSARAADPDSLKRVRVDEDRFCIRGLRAGSYLLHYEGAARVGEAVVVVPDESADLVVDLVAGAPCRLRGKAPAFARYTLSRRDAARASYAFAADQSGWFDLHDLIGGSYVVRSESAAEGPLGVVDLDPSRPALVDLNALLPGLNPLAGQILGIVAGCEAHVLVAGAPAAVQGARYSTRRRAHATGRIPIEVTTASPESRQSWWFEFFHEQPATRQDVELGPCSLSVNLGARARRVTVHTEQAIDGWMNRYASSHAPKGSHVTVSGLYAGKYRIVATFVDGSTASRSIDVPAVTEVSLVPPTGGSVELSVLTPGGAPVVGLPVVLRQGDVAPLGSVEAATTGSRGVVTFAFVPSGTYHVECGGKLWPRPVIVTDRAQAQRIEWVP